MTDASIYGFALVYLVATSAAGAWAIFGTRAEAAKLRGYVVRLHGTLNEHTKRIVTLEKQSPVNIAAKVDELSEAVGKLADTHRKFAGRMDRRYQLERDREPTEETVDDPTWNALRLAQQRSLGTPPNGSGC